MCGSYADTHAGLVSEALKDFTGGVHLRFELKTAPSNLWELMDRAAKAKALIGCGTPQGVSMQLTQFEPFVTDCYCVKLNHCYAF